MSDLLNSDIYPQKRDMQAKEAQEQFRQIYTKKNFKQHIKHLIAFKRGGFRYFSSDVHEMLKTWLRVQWNKDTKRYLAIEDNINQTLGETRYCMDVLDLVYYNDKVELDWSSRAIVIIKMATTLVININQIHDNDYQPSTYNSVWKQLEIDVEQMKIGLKPNYREGEDEEIKTGHIQAKVEDILNTQPSKITNPRSVNLFNNLENRMVIWSEEIRKFMNANDEQYCSIDAAARVIKYFKDELVMTYSYAQEEMQKAENHYNKIIDEKIIKYKKMKESIKNTTLDLDMLNLKAIENSNMKIILEQILPYCIEEELELNYADIDLDTIMDYYSNHILEIPMIMQQCKHFLRIGDGQHAEQLLMLLELNPTHPQFKEFETERIQEIQNEMEYERIPLPYMGTGDQNWLPVWLKFMLVNNHYGNRPRRADDQVQEILNGVLNRMYDIGIKHSWERKIMDEFYESMLQGFEGKKINIFSQDSTQITPENKRRRKN